MTWSPPVTKLSLGSLNNRIPTVNFGDFDFLLLRRTPTAAVLLEVSNFTSRKSAKVSSESAEWTEGVEVLYL